jgi:hypothetical protein
MLSDLASLLSVVSPRVPTDMVPVFVDILDRVMIFANSDVVYALARVSVVSSDSLSFNFSW